MVSSARVLLMVSWARGTVRMKKMMNPVCKHPRSLHHNPSPSHSRSEALFTELPPGRDTLPFRLTPSLSVAPQVETGSAITWKYPSCVLKGDRSQGEFYSVALTNNKQQADTGTKMVHVGKDTRSRIVSKGISAGKSLNCYRGLVQVAPGAEGARNFSQCDSMLIGDR